MSARKRARLLAEARAWDAIGHDIEERGEDAMFFSSRIKYAQPRVIADSMQDRTDSVTYGDDGYGMGHGAVRAIAAYWFALECREEARHAPR